MHNKYTVHQHTFTHVNVYTALLFYLCLMRFNYFHLFSYLYLLPQSWKSSMVKTCYIVQRQLCKHSELNSTMVISHLIICALPPTALTSVSLFELLLVSLLHQHNCRHLQYGHFSSFRVGDAVSQYLLVTVTIWLFMHAY